MEGFYFWVGGFFGVFIIVSIWIMVFNFKDHRVVELRSVRYELIELCKANGPPISYDRWSVICSDGATFSR